MYQMNLYQMNSGWIFAIPIFTSTAELPVINDVIAEKKKATPTPEIKNREKDVLFIE
jgi:hypothetical protein